ncbi:MAG: glycosyltransferase [Microbacter sp.]
MIVASFVFILVVSLLYWSLLINMVRHWSKSSFSVKRFDSTPLVSVVVCFHNEVLHVDRLINALKTQTYPTVEFIFVDDASTDDTKALIERHAVGTVVSLSEHVGKKQALQIGIERAQGKWVLCTDADCVMGNRWIETLVAVFQQSGAEMIIAPVRLNYNAFFSKMQAIEFLSLSAVTACSAMMHHPVLCNGANLAFSKAVWLQGNVDLKMNYVSGDDMFLLEHVKNMNGKIVYASSSEAVITTEPQETVSAFFRQRIRWASKSSGYSDREVLISAGLAAFFTLFPLLFVAMGIVHAAFLKMGLLAWVLKSLGDFFFLRRFRSFFSVWFVWYDFLPVAFIYPFYVLVVFILSRKGSQVQWR